MVGLQLGSRFHRPVQTTAVNVLLLKGPNNPVVKRLTLTGLILRLVG